MTLEEEIAIELDRLGLADAFRVKLRGDEAELSDADGRGQRSSAVLPARLLLDALSALYPVPDAAREAATEAGEGDIAWEAVWDAVVRAYPPAATARKLG